MTVVVGKLKGLKSGRGQANCLDHAKARRFGFRSLPRGRCGVACPLVLPSAVISRTVGRQIFPREYGLRRG